MDKRLFQIGEVAHMYGVSVGISREMALIDYGMTNDTDKFVTEICLPVGKRQ